MWLLRTFLGLLLLPVWTQWLIILGWAALTVLAAWTQQYLPTAIMAVLWILFLFARHQFKRGRTLLGRSMRFVIKDAPLWARQRYDQIRSRFGRRHSRAK